MDGVTCYSSSCYLVVLLSWQSSSSNVSNSRSGSSLLLSSAPQQQAVADLVIIMSHSLLGAARWGTMITAGCMRILSFVLPQLGAGTTCCGCCCPTPGGHA
jgi:hypothetical protein